MRQSTHRSSDATVRSMLSQCDYAIDAAIDQSIDAAGAVQPPSEIDAFTIYATVATTVQRMRSPTTVDATVK